MYIKVILIILTVLTIGSVIRILIGPTIWDRLLSLNVFSSKLTMIIILLALYYQKTFILDIALVYVLFGFVSILFIARFIERKGRV